MKKILTFIVLLISFAGMSQGVTITTDKTATQLINQVLVSSPCFVATSVTAKSGNDFSSTNGIGYFENTNPNFPFANGVVITSGDVTKVPSPNNAVQSDGIPTWPGDTDMQAALLAQGVTINSVNASKLEFDFIATTTTFNLSFLFASEEYGASQCNFSDAFAFLIKDITVGFTTGYQNAATVPGPATAGTPITVATIRDALYNPNCTSVNPQFFGAYNGNGFGPAINFNGQTVPMTASAPLVLNHTYHVKLVVADGNNNVGYDSAIFLEAKSLNIGGQVLGLDYVPANVNAGRNGICFGSAYPTLQPETPLPAGTTYKWEKLQTNNTYQQIGGQTTSTLVLGSALGPGGAPQVGLNYYKLKYLRIGCVEIEDIIVVQVFADINSLAIVPALSKCNNPSATSYTYDLIKTRDIILNNNTPGVFDDLIGVTITFHNSIADANNNVAVGNTKTITSGEALAGFDMWAKIKKNATGCYDIRNFKLKLVPSPIIANQPLNITLCGLVPSPAPRADFDLNANILLMLGSQDPTIYAFSYHPTQLDADNNTNPIYVGPSGIKNTITITYFVRLQNILDPTCTPNTTANFTLTVTPLAYVDILPDVIVCNKFVLPALVQVGAQYFESIDGTGPQHFANEIITPGATPTTIYVYNSNGACKTNDPFKITKANLTAVAPASASYCRQYLLPFLPYGVYYKFPGGPSANPSGATPANFLVNVAGANIFYVWFENLAETPVCGQEKTFTITIIPLADFPVYDNKFACSSYVLPAAGNGGTYYSGPNKLLPIIATGTAINATKTIYVYKETGGTPNCFTETSFVVTIGVAGLVPADVNSCSSYALPPLLVGQYCMGPNGANPYPANPVISATGDTIVYFFVPGQSCTANLSFKVTISLLPLAPIADVVVCDFFTFPVVAGRPNGKYYTTSGLGSPSDPFKSQGQTIYTLGAQTYYFKDKALTGSCYVEEQFLLTINATPCISQRPISVVRCNQNFILDNLLCGNYYKFSGGLSGTNPVLPPFTTILTTNDPAKQYNEIWVYAGSNIPGNTCFQEYSIKIYFVNTNVNPVANVTACDTYALPSINGLGDYYTMSGGPLVIGNTKIILPKNILTTTTLYVYAEDNNRVACSDEESFTVTIIKRPKLNPVAPISVCDTFTIPQFNDPIFTFTAANPGVVTKFYKNPGGALANPLSNDVYTPGTLFNGPIVLTLYPYAENIDNTIITCFDDEPYVITINKTPTIVPAEVVNLTKCDTYTLPVLTVGKYYSTAAHATADELTGAQLILTAPSTTVYVYAETGTNPNCAAPVLSFVVTIVTTPIISAIASVAVCDQYTLPLHSDPMFTSTNPITKFYKNAGGPINNPLPSDEYAENQTISTSLIIYPYTAVGSVPCFDDEPFIINITNSPIIVTAEVVNITKCDTYTLPALTVGKYYTTAAHTTELTGAQLTLTAPSTTVYVYAETGTTPNCTAPVLSFVVTIVTTPVINPIAAVFSCDTYVIPAYGNPMFTSTNPITKFYKNAGGPSANLLATDEYLPNQVVTNSNLGTAPYVFTVYAYSAIGTVPCFDNKPFVVTINKSPIIVASEVISITKCDSYTLPALTVGTYVTSSGVPITNFNITTTQTVYVRAKNGVTPNICVDNKNFIVTINKTPVFTVSEVADVSTCNSYTLPALSISGAKYYTGNNATGIEIAVGSIFTSDTTVFAYAETATTPNCFVSESINIQIYNVYESGPKVQCGSYILPALADPNANYYNYSGGVGLIAQGTTLFTSQTVYINGTSPNSTCTDESNFLVTINTQPIANDALDTVCDTDSSPYDGITSYDFTKLLITNQILGSTQPATNFTITYFSDPNRQVAINTPSASSLSTVYVFVTNNLSPTCPSPAKITINVIRLPNPKFKVPPICIDSETGVITNSVIESGYNSIDYTIIWTKASDGTTVGNDQSFSTDIPGNYILNVNSNSVTSCASGNVPFTVIISAKPAVTPPISFAITGWFTNSQTITVTATPFIGDGTNFVYSLDGDTPQVSNIFTNVGTGAHEITVIDINGCGSRALPIPVKLVSSPAAFTPNGDGINDTWDIEGDILYSSLTIYDRYGRLLKQLTQKNKGWDGTINSQALPADDYWFSLNYIDSSGAPKEYKSHFSLIR